MNELYLGLSNMSGIIGALIATVVAAVGILFCFWGFNLVKI